MSRPPRHAIDQAIGTDAALAELVARAVHHQIDWLTMPCQCGACWRVERLVRRLGEAAQASTAEAETRVRLTDQLVGIWRGLAVIEREHAGTDQSMAPAMRSVHQHRALVYEACATDLANARR